MCFLLPRASQNALSSTVTYGNLSLILDLAPWFEIRSVLSLCFTPLCSLHRECSQTFPNAKGQSQSLWNLQRKMCIDGVSVQTHLWDKGHNSHKKTVRAVLWRFLRCRACPRNFHVQSQEQATTGCDVNDKEIFRIFVLLKNKLV